MLLHNMLLHVCCTINKLLATCCHVYDGLQTQEQFVTRINFNLPSHYKPALADSVVVDYYLSVEVQLALERLQKPRMSGLKSLQITESNWHDYNIVSTAIEMVIIRDEKVTLTHNTRGLLYLCCIKAHSTTRGQLHCCIVRHIIMRQFQHSNSKIDTAK